MAVRQSRVASVSAMANTTRFAPVFGKPVFRDIHDVAKHHDCRVPVFCFHPARLERRIKCFVDGFAGDLSYAVKANSSEELLKRAAAFGLATFDVASLGEIERVRDVFPGARLHYHNPVKSSQEISEAYFGHGCRRFAVDCLEELDKISRITGNHESVEIAVRFKMPRHAAAVYDFSSKFGASISDSAMLLRQVVARNFIPVLTFHPGSQCLEPGAWAEHVHCAAGIARAANVKLHGLNVGGGFPVNTSANKVPALSAFFAAINTAADEAFADRVPKLECEPGRAICAPAFTQLTAIKLFKQATGEVYLNDGIYGGLLETSQAADLLPVYQLVRDGIAVEGPRKPYTIYGPTCDPLDVLPNKIALPADLREGDIIAFFQAGAYSQAMATQFNGYGASQIVTVAD